MARLYPRILCAAILTVCVAGLCRADTGPQKQGAQVQQDQAQAGKTKQPEAKNLDLVSDVVADAFAKTNALLTGNLEITMDRKTDKRDDYTINALGQRVPKSTAIRSGSSLHNDDPL